MIKVIECTGVPCVGKSTFLEFVHKSNPELVFSRCDLIPGSLRKAIPVVGRLYAEVKLLVLYLFDGPLSFRNHWDLLRASLNCNESFFFSLNIFRNVLLKFAVDSYVHKRYRGEIVFIDEGISHLPFLFQNSTSDLRIVDGLYARFREIMASNLVLIMEAGDADIGNRLANRGHKRLKSRSEIEIAEFMKSSFETLEQIKAALNDHRIPCRVIDVSDENRFSSHLQSILGTALNSKDYG